MACAVHYIIEGQSNLDEPASVAEKRPEVTQDKKTFTPIPKTKKRRISHEEKMLSIALALCLALSLAIPVCAAEITEEPMITPSNPAHPYAPSPDNTADPNWTSGSNSTHQFITANAITITLYSRRTKQPD